MAFARLYRWSDDPALVDRWLGLDVRRTKLIVFMVSALAIVVNQFVSTPAQAASGLALVAAGVPIYYLRNAYR